MKRMAFIAACCVAAAANAGVYIELVDHDIQANTTSPALKMYVQGGSARFVDEEGKTSLIKGDTMYILDPDDKSYIVFDKVTMEQLAKQMNAGVTKMKEQLAKLPPEQRAQIEAQMGPMLGGGGGKKWVVEATDTGKSDKVDGRACRIWEVKRNGELDDQICVVAYSALPGKENLQEVFANFSKVFEEMAKAVPMLEGMMSNEFDAQAKVNGFPVRSRGYEDGKLGNEEQLVKVWREEAIPASMFEVPAGYKKKAMPMGPGAN
jgi:hypothetical protein